MRHLHLAALTFCVAACGAPTDTPEPQVEPAPAAIAFPEDNFWTVDPAESALTFSGTQEGQTFSGRFTEFDAQISLDPEALDSAMIRVSVDLSSARTGDSERDEALPGREWFHTAQFPTAVYQSDTITREAGNAYRARGELNLKGVRQAVDLPFTLDIDGDTARAKGQVTLDRSNYSVGSGAFATDEWVGHNVEVRFSLTATRAN